MQKLCFFLSLSGLAYSNDWFCKGNQSPGNECGDKNNADWMAAIDDNKKLIDLSIPGTHQSMSYVGDGVGGQTGFAQCNTMSIESQLKSGIRAFDIRLRPAGNSFAIHHGVVFQKKMFGEFLNDARAFLKAHPKEVLLVDHTKEHSDASSATYWKIMNSYRDRYSDIVVKNNIGNHLTLGDVRGKVIIGSADMNDFDRELSNDWVVKKIEDKLWGVKENLNAAMADDKNSGCSKMYITYISGHNLGAHSIFGKGTPADIARQINEPVGRHIGDGNSDKRKIGIVMMDYPGDELIRRIVRRNTPSVTSKSNLGACAKSRTKAQKHAMIEFDNWGWAGEDLCRKVFAARKSDYNIMIIGDNQDNFSTSDNSAMTTYTQWVQINWWGFKREYRVYIAPYGTKFTVKNTGNGGWNNWCFSGRYNRDGKRVDFY